MYAIVETGGKQYRVTKGDIIQVEKLEKEKGKITLDKVLLIENDKETLVGAPYIEGAAVEAKVLDHGKGKKIIIYKYTACSYKLSISRFNAESFGFTVSTVFRATYTFFTCHLSHPFSIQILYLLPLL